MFKTKICVQVIIKTLVNHHYIPEDLKDIQKGF